ncbi:MAG: hypothetical protein KIS67_20640 [Verrucomicrobiae bacterium]|nr:hypothetical protein [Verrucomicrobiae bacterium]
MKPIAWLTLGLFTALAGRAQEDQPLPPAALDGITANQTVAYNLLTNLIGQLSEFGVSVHVESLTLNLNGFALVGLANSLTAPTAEQTVAESPSATMEAGANRQTLPLKQTVSRIEVREDVIRVGDGGTNQLVISHTNLPALASNLFGVTPTKGLRLHLGRLTLNLNGYALVGVTNFVDQPTASQQLTNTPAVPRDVKSAPPPSPRTNTLDGAGLHHISPPVIRRASPASATEVYLEELAMTLNGTAVIGLPARLAEWQPALTSPASPSP